MSCVRKFSLYIILQYSRISVLNFGQKHTVNEKVYRPPSAGANDLMLLNGHVIFKQLSHSVEKTRENLVQLHDQSEESQICLYILLFIVLSISTVEMNFSWNKQ